MTDPVIAEAIKARDGLREVEKELNTRYDMDIAKRIGGYSTLQELRKIDVGYVREAQRLLQKLGTEVTRLRLAIQHHQQGYLTIGDLWKLPDSWNDDPPEKRNDRA